MENGLDFMTELNVCLTIKEAVGNECRLGASREKVSPCKGPFIINYSSIAI